MIKFWDRGRLLIPASTRTGKLSDGGELTFEFCVTCTNSASQSPSPRRSNITVRSTSRFPFVKWEKADDIRRITWVLNVMMKYVIYNALAVAIRARYKGVSFPQVLYILTCYYCVFSECVHHLPCEKKEDAEKWCEITDMRGRSGRWRGQRELKHRSSAARAITLVLHDISPTFWLRPLNPFLPADVWRQYRTTY